MFSYELLHKFATELTDHLIYVDQLSVNTECRLEDLPRSTNNNDDGIANGLGVLRSIPSRVMRKTQKMVLDTSLLNTQDYKVRIKRNGEVSRQRNSALPY